MSGGITNFLAKGTGPQQLRATLRSKTRLLGALPRSLSAWQTVRTATPQAVLGGDLIGLLSYRLRALLQGDEPRPDEVKMDQPGHPKFTDRTAARPSPASTLFSKFESAQAQANRFAAMEAVGASHPKFTDRTALTEPPAPAFSSNREAGQARASEWEAIEALFRRHGLSASPDVDKSDSLADSLTPSRRQAASTPEWETTRGGADGQHSFLPGEREAMSQRRSGGGPRSLLVEKLREYWELSQSPQTAEKDANRMAGAATKSQSPSTLSPAPPTAQTPQSRPAISARQLARQARLSMADISSTHTRHTSHSGSPDKVEIQNVFNIEVKATGGGDFTDDLSERLSDILLEQALQQGIDVT